MNIGEAAAAIGLEEHDDEDAAVVAFPNGTPVNRTLRACADRSMDQVRDLYAAGATFKRGSIQPYEGRKRENVKRILWLGYDFDAIDWLGFDQPGPDRKKALDELHGLDQEDLDELIAAQRPDVDAAMFSARLPVHRLDYTGYGLCAYTYCGEGERVAEWIDLYRDSVRHINNITGRPLADRQVSDAGTRITRLVPCLNTKGARPRVAHTLSRSPGFATIEGLRGVVGTTAPTPIRPDIALPTARRRDLADLDKVIEVFAEHWNLGFRHWHAMALAGFLAKAGLPQDQTEHVIWQLAAGDDEMGDRLKAVTTTYQRLAKGEQIAGYMRLRETLPAHTLGYLDDLLSPKPGAKVTALRRVEAPPKEVPDAAPETTYTDPPAACFNGFLQAYADLMVPSTEAPVGYHLGVGLTIAGALLGRGLWTQAVTPRPLYLNMFLLLIGATGSKKDTASELGLWMAQAGRWEGTRHIPTPLKLIRGIDTAPKLIQDLGEWPETLAFVSEYATLAHHARRDVSRDLMPTLTHAWDCPPSLENRTKTDPQIAEKPYLNLITTTQPRTMADLATGGDQFSGWLNRFLVIAGEATEPKAFPAIVSETRIQELLDWIAQARQEYSGPIPWDEALRERWTEWYDAHHPSRDGGTEQDHALTARHPAYVWKIAAIHAVMDGAPKIGEKHLEAGIATVEWAWGNLRHLIPEWGASTAGALEARIEAVLRKFGVQSKREIQMRARDDRWSAVDFNKTFEALIEVNAIAAERGGYVWKDA